MGNWHQIKKIQARIKGIKVQIKIIEGVFEMFPKEKANLLLLVSEWYWEKLGLKDLQDNDVKLTSDMNLVLKIF